RRRRYRGIFGIVVTTGIFGIIFTGIFGVVSFTGIFGGVALRRSRRLSARGVTGGRGRVDAAGGRGGHGEVEVAWTPREVAGSRGGHVDAAGGGAPTAGDIVRATDVGGGREEGEEGEGGRGVPPPRGPPQGGGGAPRECRSFGWFLREVAPDILQHFPLNQPDPVARGKERKSPPSLLLHTVTRSCLEAHAASSSQSALSLRPCDPAVANQQWIM
ncbi:unnamed protein product, partial [Lampetra fluviatilis]